jgi:hypothetical protein
MTDKNPDNVVSQHMSRRHKWKRIHHSPLFWVGFCFLLAAIAMYLWTDDLSWRPQLH